MRATELIRELQGLVEAHGDDLEVYLSSRWEGGALEQLQLKDYPRQINPQPDGTVYVLGPAVVFSPVPEPISELARKRSQWRAELDSGCCFHSSMGLGYYCKTIPKYCKTIPK